MKFTGGQIIAKALKANSVDYVAGPPGDGARALVEALGAPLQARNTLQPGISVRRPAKEESIGTVEALPPSPAAWNQCWP